MIAELLTKHFRGRPDKVAVGANGGFHHEPGPVTVERVNADHLSGVVSLGFYLMCQDSRVWCSCIDIDNHAGEDSEWRSKVELVSAWMNAIDIPYLVEVSQSGEGAHVWIFFDEATDAWIPRAFWRGIGAKLDIRFKEIYPRQDRIDAAGFGNLVRYPLWNLSRFVDVDNGWETMEPVAAMEGIRTTSSTDLRLVSFQSGAGELSPDPVVTVTHIEGSGDVLPIRVTRLLDSGSTLLFRRWNNDGAGMADSSRSAVAMSLCCELVRAYVPTPEIAATLRAWCNRHAYQEKGNRDDWINRTLAKSYDFVVQRREKQSTGVSTLRDAAHAYIDTIEAGNEIVVPSGIPDLDKLIGGGISPGEVAIIAGRPSHGKSAVGFQWMANAGANGVKGLIISEEMGRIQVGKRRLMSVTSIPIDQWVPASASVLRRDVDAHHKGHADVFIVESCGTVDRAEELIDQFCSLYGVGFVMIDYLQLLSARASKDRYEVVTECSRRIKQCAVRNNVPTLLLSQLNRGIEARDEHEPKLSDLRESGQIEQDADKVFFCVYPSRFTDAPDDIYYVYCGKNRNGPGAGERVETTFNPKKQIIGFEGLPQAIQEM